MLKAFNQHKFFPFYNSFIQLNKTQKYLCYHATFHFSSTTDSNKQRKYANQTTLDYATLLQYVRPEMQQRIQHLIDHENYLSSLSHQIQEKQKYLQELEQKEKHKQPQLHNQKLSNLVLESLQKDDNQDDEHLMYEPGLDLQDLSSITNFKSTFYGPNPLNDFEELNIDKYLIKAINDMGINIPSHIQQLSIPQILKGHNCVVGAETGTGKTIAYVLPILHKLLHDKTVTESKFDPISKFKENHLSQDNNRKSHHKYHPFEFDAEKKFPICLIIQPNEHLCNQVQSVINEILYRYYDAIYFEKRNSDQYKIKTMSLHGRALLPKSNELMPDILITTPTAMLTNIHKKHNENRYRAFLSKIKYVILDEADYLTRSSSRHQLRYVFTKLKELRQQIEKNPLKYKLLLPKYLRDEEYGATPSLLYKELNKIGKPQMIFVGATIPTQGSRNVAETIRDWLDKAIWIKTPGLHEICGHIAQEFRFVPREMELDILNQILIGLARDHLYKNMFETDDDILYSKDNHEKPMKETGRHKKRKQRAKKPKNAKELEMERKSKSLHILIFVNTKQFTRECYKYLLENGWFNTRCIHSQLHREERKQRMQEFQDSVPCVNTELSDNLIKKNIAINEAITSKDEDDDVDNDDVDNEEYKQVVDNVHLLVTSDFANRGVDFKNVDIVINAQFPDHAIDYLHRCGRTGRGGNTNDNGRVISFFNEYDLDLAWHIQMALINQYKKTLKTMENVNINKDNNDASGEQDNNRIGTTSVRLDDCFGVDDYSLSNTLRFKKGRGGYHRMSLPRDYEKNIDLTRIDLDEMDEKLVDHIIKYAKKEKWINNNKNNNDFVDDDDNDDIDNDKVRKTSDKQLLKDLIEERKEKKRKIRVPWPYQLAENQ